MAWPEGSKSVLIKSLGKNSSHYKKEIKQVEWLETQDSLSFEQNDKGLKIAFPDKAPLFPFAVVLKITG
ncbi:alpha-L-fucosidase C-terminal domain-containing protein [Niabella hibiscisoli]|uniref:alpha-L-fucosidase C-terminal domain-containing protein n=1 Tax=Niabella hibiscisoli TaxID=1825928 RepID=UPI001F0EEE00|nr:alpha-L-fucosidase C-terminal domain-containing protein [Niabella hibiscisoli]MCH5720763.1 hypothetical protein [Niabella hibiscisoli]